MPFRQPNLSIIKPYNFLENTYTFPVEAIMATESGGGQLRIDVTEAYLLKTTANESLQNYQTLDYVRQTNGSWLANGTVTLVATASSLLNGTIHLRTPEEEVLQIDIQVEPALFINESLIGFDDTEPGESASTILTIHQQGAITPVSLRVEPATVFTVADAKMASLTAFSLSLTPSLEGAHVIVNYSPNQPGYHNAHLVVSTPYDTKTIQLSGQTGGIMSWVGPLLSRLRSVPKLSVSVPLPKLTTLSRQFDLLRWHLVRRRSYLLGAAMVLVLGDLVWMNYALLSESKNLVSPPVVANRLVKPTHRPATSVSPAAKPASQPLALPIAAKEDQASVEQPQLTTLTEPAVESNPVTKSEPLTKSEPVVESRPVTKSAPARPLDLAVKTKPTVPTQPKVRPLEQRMLAHSSKPVAPALPTPKSYHPVPAKSSLPTLARTEPSKPNKAATINPVNQVSDLEKELNEPVYHRRKP